MNWHPKQGAWLGVHKHKPLFLSKFRSLSEWHWENFHLKKDIFRKGTFLTENLPNNGMVMMMSNFGFWSGFLIWSWSWSWRQQDVVQLAIFFFSILLVKRHHVTFLSLDSCPCFLYLWIYIYTWAIQSSRKYQNRVVILARRSRLAINM